ncbi:MAG: preprotein translocase subunit SecE [Planctomycetota bacterium]
MVAAIYKAGQGYWVRALSAVFFGVLALAAAAWGWGQASAVDLPLTGYAYSVTGVEGDVAPGTVVEIIAPSRDIDETPVVLGTATVSLYEQREAGISAIEVSDVIVTSEDLRPDEATVIQTGSDGAFVAQVRPNTSRGLEIFPPIYLQAGVAGILILAGAIAIYYFIGINRGSVEFLIATDGEMKKVNWSTRREVIGSTWVVIIAAFLIAAILFGIDTSFSAFFQAVGVLET